MTTMELKALKTKLIDGINAANSVDEIAERLDDILQNAMWKRLDRIPGVPCTDEEVREAIARSLQEIDEGIEGIPADEADRRIRERLPWLKN